MMNWTTKRPTESGAYWIKDGDSIPTVVNVSIPIGCGDGDVWWAGGYSQLLSSLDDAKWCGPLIPPCEEQNKLIATQEVLS